MAHRDFKAYVLWLYFGLWGLFCGLLVGGCVVDVQAFGIKAVILHMVWCFGLQLFESRWALILIYRLSA